MKNIATFAVLFLLILLLTKVANQVPPEPSPGTAFSLKSQKVIECSPHEITLMDSHFDAIHLQKDESWPDSQRLKKIRSWTSTLQEGRRHIL